MKSLISGIRLSNEDVKRYKPLNQSPMRILKTEQMTRKLPSIVRFDSIQYGMGGVIIGKIIPVLILGVL